MADVYPRLYDVAFILEHPALHGLGEFLHEVHESESMARFTENRFIGHERDITLQPDAIDSDEIEATYQRQYEARCERFDTREAQHRTFDRQNRLVEAGFDPDSTRESAWDDLEDIVHTPRQRRERSAYENTSLDDTAPELASTGPSRYPQCRSQGAEQLEYSELVADWIQDRLESLVEEREDREKIRKLHKDLDRYFDTMALKKRAILDTKARIETAAGKWHSEDPVAYSKWEAHVKNSYSCSTAQNRIWQIVHWYNKDVPDDLYEAVGDLTRTELSLVDNTLNYKRDLVQLAELEGEQNDAGPCYCIRHLLLNDETFNMGVQDMIGSVLYFGHDYDHDFRNGFSDYIAPKGDGVRRIAALAEHITANLSTRQIRLQHNINLDEEDADFEVDKSTTTALKASFSKFINKVQNVVDVEMHKLLGGDWIPPPDALKQAEADRQALVGVQKAIRAARAELGLPRDEDLSDIDI